MIYDKFTFIEPPRAEKAIPPSLLKAYEMPGWVAQAKKNGTNSVIFISPDKEMFAYNRHGVKHKNWSFDKDNSQAFRNLPGKGWYVINAELLHAKVKGLRDVNYIHDILVDDGEYLCGTSYASRYVRLQNLFFNQAMKAVPTHWILNKYTWLARNFRDNFRDAFDSLKSDEDEGLVLKNMNGILQSKSNNGWTVKCRRNTKNFGF